MNEVLAAVQREWGGGRPAAAYLLLGSSRRNLRRLAEEIAALILQTSAPARDHPDCTILDPEALEVPGLRVEHVAERDSGSPSVEAALRYRPLRGAARAVLLYDVDRMTPDAQAALLKTAEEPPPGTVLLLTAADLSPLLPALRSRCRAWRVPSPAAAALWPAAEAGGWSAAEWEACVAACPTPEAALELDAEQRRQLAQTRVAFQAWLAEPGRAPDWLEAPQGAALAEERAQGIAQLAACLGWVARDYRDADPERALLLDAVAAELHLALADLAAQLAPSVVFEDLRLRINRL